MSPEVLMAEWKMINHLIIQYIFHLTNLHMNCTSTPHLGCALKKDGVSAAFKNKKHLFCVSVFIRVAQNKPSRQGWPAASLLAVKKASKRSICYLPSLQSHVSSQWESLHTEIIKTPRKKKRDQNPAFLFPMARREEKRRSNVIGFFPAPLSAPSTRLTF